MLVELLIETLFLPVRGLLNMIPPIDFSIPVESIDSFLGYVDMAAFFVPVDTVITLLGIVLTVEMCKIVIAFLKMLWKFVPLFGA